MLSHYGVHGLDRTPALEEAVFRIFLAQRRAGSDVAVVTALLQQWLTEGDKGYEAIVDEKRRLEATLAALEGRASLTPVRRPTLPRICVPRFGAGRSCAPRLATERGSGRGR